MTDQKMEIRSTNPFNEKRLKFAGLPAPGFTLENQHGKKVSLKSLTRNGMALLFFYSANDDPGVSDELAELDAFQEKFQDMHIVPAAISRDTVETHARYAESRDLTIFLLADPEFEVSKAYGVYNENGVNSRVSFIVSTTGEIVRVYSGRRMRSHVRSIYQNAREVLAP